jgi:integrase
LSVVLDLLLGTGLRVGEALALRWRDVVDEDGKLWVNVNATLVQFKNGHGLTRRETPKTAASVRLVPLPRFAAEAIGAKRFAAGTVEPTAYVFPARKRDDQIAQAPRSRSSWSKSLRKALSAGGLADIGFTSHTARGTVALVVVEATGSAENAAQLLGHQLSRSVTPPDHTERTRKAPDQTEVIQAFIDLSETLVPLPGPRLARAGAPIVIQP